MTREELKMDEKTCDNCAWRENGCDGEDVCERYKEVENADVQS